MQFSTAQTFRKLQRNFCFGLWHVVGVGFRGVGLGLTDSCNALHDRKMFPECFLSCHLCSGLNPVIHQNSSCKSKLHELKNILRIYFRSGMGLHDRKNGLGIYLEIIFARMVTRARTDI